MRPLTLDDLVPLPEFAARRADFFAAHSRYLARYRRVRVGPKLTLVFENRQTLWYRVQEVLRVARLAEPARLQAELDWYNHLLPVANCLQAALLIDVSDEQYWTNLGGEHLRLTADDDSVAATLVTCRPEDRCYGAAHWVSFPTTAELRASLADLRRPASLSAEYRDYRHRSSELSESVRRSLLQDLDSNQAQAA
jgi:hypothetical protein